VIVLLAFVLLAITAAIIRVIMYHRRGGITPFWYKLIEDWIHRYRNKARDKEECQ
jgi:hypothetical protein